MQEQNGKIWKVIEWFEKYRFHILIILGIISAITIFFGLIYINKNDNSPIKIDYTLSAEKLKQYDGKTVTFKGYYTTVEPLNNITYIVDIPCAMYPYSTESGLLNGSIAIQTNITPTFTTCPLKITGKLKIDSYTDDYGYSYNMLVENAEVEILQENEYPEDLKWYYKIAEKEYLLDLLSIISTLDFLCYYDEYEEDVKTAIPKPIEFSNYKNIKQEIESLDSEKHNELLSVLEKSNTFLQKVNENIKTGEYEKNLEYKSEIDVIYEEYNHILSHCALVEEKKN